MRGGVEKDEDEEREKRRKRVKCGAREISQGAQSCGLHQERASVG